MSEIKSRNGKQNGDERILSSERQISDESLL